MCVVVTETELEEKNHTTAGIIFCLTNTCAQICAQGPDRADRLGDVFRSSFCHSWIRLPFLKEVGGRGAVRWWFSVP